MVCNIDAKCKMDVTHEFVDKVEKMKEQKKNPLKIKNIYFMSARLFSSVHTVYLKT